MKEVLIEEWSVVYKEKDYYKAPEQKSLHLSGTVYNHPSCEDGNSVVTSSIKDVDGIFVYTANTKYKLGNPSQQYVDWYYANYGKELDKNNPFSGVEV